MLHVACIFTRKLLFGRYFRVVEVAGRLARGVEVPYNWSFAKLQWRWSIGGSCIKSGKGVGAFDVDRHCPPLAAGDENGIGTPGSGAAAEQRVLGAEHGWRVRRIAG